MLVWHTLLTFYISTGPLRYEQAFNRRLADLSLSTFRSVICCTFRADGRISSSILSYYSLERTDYMVERSDQRMERSGLKRSGHGTK